VRKKWPQCEEARAKADARKRAWGGLCQIGWGKNRKKTFMRGGPWTTPAMGPKKGCGNPGLRRKKRAKGKGLRSRMGVEKEGRVEKKTVPWGGDLLGRAEKLGKAKSGIMGGLIREDENEEGAGGWAI